ncbi:P-loop containing nucleoside triphosphate hydrolase protein [Pleomassaria siparia CBS 279.74]|uniref:P-loop containing nucleoside triphosphate hydrolase protein n=1 Tax=Pleomassaria siparia CBS 279.74 TaxID=1314801 RepID=A0A6G1KKJ3_9PLEO|nr:P-loop containing nucleoside triphosphate hydrolase protein [Pleomassaria siparia CBS 279.74]
MSQACYADGSFGPAIGSGCRGGFDFTLVFEDSMLGLLPHAALLLLAPLRLATLRRRRQRVAKNSHLGFLKMFTSGCYAISAIMLLIIWCEIDVYKTRLSIASASLVSLASLMVVTLSRLEHTRAVKPSHLLQFFLLVLLLCDAVRLRTLFLMDYPASLVMSASIHTFLTALLLLLESLDKRQLFSSNRDRMLPPEETIGLFGRRLIWHLNGLFEDGYRKILKPTDLFTIDADLASKERERLFQTVWNHQKKSGKSPLAWTIYKVLWLDLLLPVIPRIIQMIATLSQPYLITAMINFIQRHNNPDTKNVGYGLICAYALNYSLLAISSSWCAQNVARFSTKLRSCLISLIYEKTLHVTSKDVNLGAATVLMQVNVDVEKVLNGTRYMNELWAAVISTAVALYILYRHLGVSFVAPFLTTLVVTCICMQIGSRMRTRQMDWAVTTQARVTSISYVVGCIKGVRMLGLSETVHGMLTTLRELEVAAHTHVRKLTVWVILISNTMFQTTTLATYVTYTAVALSKPGGLTLNFNVLYGSMSALKLVTSPMMHVLLLIPQIQASLASLTRIQDFLASDSFGEEASPVRHIGSSDIGLHQNRKQDSIVEVKDAAFGFDAEKPILFDISLTCQSESLTMVIGKVGSGKSVLLRSLVGEARLLQGSFDPLPSGTAFCDQTVWLRNVTVRDNIIGEDVFEEAWYNDVLWSCNLTQDLDEMKKGDFTSIGSKGITLSGGQKNRISLARALYARKPILVVDDMLAGLDNTTEKLVFDRVFGRNGLLRRSGATVILATHATYFARHADNIIVLSKGRIIEDGTYQDLVAKKFNFSEMDASPRGITNDADPIETVSSESSPMITARVPNVDPEEEIEEDDARRAGDRQSLIFFMKSVGILHCLIYFGLCSLATVTTTIQFLWLKWWAHSNDTSRAGNIRSLYMFIIITLVNIFCFLAFIAHWARWFVPRASLALHAAQLKALMRAKFSYLVSTDTGSITNRFSQDIGLVDSQLQGAWLNFTEGVLIVFSQIAILIVATPLVGVTIPLLGGVSYLIQRVYLRTSRQVRLMDLEAKAPLCTHFLESLAGIVTIRSFGWTTAFRKRNNELLEQSQVPFYLLLQIQNWLTLVVELMVTGLVTSMVGLAVALRSKVDPGYLGLALVAAMDLGFQFRIIILSWTELETSLSAVTRIKQFSNPEIIPHESDDTEKPYPPRSWPTAGSVIFHSLSASYAVNGKTVLNRIDLNIKAGEKVGLCGRTGSGKSSLVATLFGLLHQQGGEILIDNIPTTNLSLVVLRSKIIALPQEAFFLKGTVRHNLAPWITEANVSSVSNAQMKDALEQVQLWGKLSSATEGGSSVLDMSLDNVDDVFSQGERQLFCLARAILMDGKIVVLDEATSSVDAQTDALMQRVLRTAFADRTIIAIAHRLDTILDFDRVVVMDAGSIAEIGQPAALMHKDGSLFKTLVESQGNK